MTTIQQEKKTIASRLERDIKRDIMLGNLQPNRRIRMRELTEMYRVTSIPLREALSRLTASGFIEVKEHQGYTVKPVTIDEILDITRARLLVDTEVLSDSILNADLDWEARLIETFHRLSNTPMTNDNSGDLSDSWESIHIKFHQTLFSNCRSAKLLELSNNLLAQSSRYRFLSVKTKGNLSRNIPDEHTEIFNAAIKRDRATAVELLKEHYQRTADNIAFKLSEKTETSKG